MEEKINILEELKARLEKKEQALQMAEFSDQWDADLCRELRGDIKELEAQIKELEKLSYSAIYLELSAIRSACRDLYISELLGDLMHKVKAEADKEVSE